VHCTGRFVCRFAERADSGSFIAFLEELRKRFGRILVCLDNTGYHKSAAVKNILMIKRWRRAWVPSSVHARAQPGGGTVALHPQGHRQQAVWEYGGDKGVDSCNAG